MSMSFVCVLDGGRSYSKHQHDQNTTPAITHCKYERVVMHLPAVSIEPEITGSGASADSTVRFGLQKRGSE